MATFRRSRCPGAPDRVTSRAAGLRAVP
jgi:hypothetical protein